MAIDNTPPKLKLIVTIGVIVVVTLVGLNFVFSSYMAYMTDMAMHDKLDRANKGPSDLQALHEAEKNAFAKAKMPLDQAMKQVAAGTRDPSITPQASDDTGALTGWTKLPRPLPNAQMIGAVAAIPAADAGAAPMAAGDAGAAPMAAGDAGATPMAVGVDAGAAPHAAGDAGAATGHPHH